MRASGARIWLIGVIAGLLLEVLPAPHPARAADEPALSVGVLREARGLAARGELQAALDKTERALSFARAELGPYDPLVGFILDDLATLNYRLGRLDRALARAEEALPVIRAARGPDSTGYALVAANLATVLSALERTDEALELYRDALPVLERDLGRAHPRTATIAQNLATLQARRGDLVAAADSYAIAVDAWGRIPGSEAALGRALIGRAEVLLEQDALEAARADADAAREALQDLPTAAPRDLAAAERVLADIELRSLRPIVARAHLQSAASRLEAADAADGAEAARILGRLATLELFAGDHAAAARALERVLELERQRLGARHPALADLHRRLGEARLGEGDLAAAEAELREGLRLLDGADRAELEGAIRALLARVLLATDRPVDAASMLEAPIEGKLGRAQMERLWEAGFERLVALWRHLPPERRDAEAERLETVLRTDAPGCDARGTALMALAAAAMADGEFAAAQERLEEGRAATSPEAGCRTGVGASIRLMLADFRLADGRARDAIDLVRETGRFRSSDGGMGRHRFERALGLVAAATAGQPGGAELGLMVDLAQDLHLAAQTQIRHGLGDAAAGGEGPAAERWRERRELCSAIRILEGMLRDPAGGSLSEQRRRAAEAALERMYEDQARLEQAIRTASGDLARWVLPEPIPLPTIQMALGAGEALLIQVTDQRTTRLLLIRPESVAYAESDVGAGTLRTWIEAARSGIRSEGAFDSFPLHALYVGLISPFATMLPDIDHLFLMPDRAMHDLPLGALVAAPAEPVAVAGDFGALDFLIEQVAVSVVPDPAALLGTPVPSRAPLPFIGLASPAAGEEPGPDPAREARLQALGHAVTPDAAALVYDLHATAGSLRAVDLAEFRSLTFAMPAVGTASGAPALALDGAAGPGTGEQARLDAAAIGALGLDADLVVLLADEAGASGPGAPPPLLDLAPAFAFAGAQAVIVGHWPASAEAVGAVVGAATARVLEDAADPARALRAVTLPLLDGDGGAPAAHPRFWAPFTAVDGGRP